MVSSRPARAIEAWYCPGAPPSSVVFEGESVHRREGEGVSGKYSLIAAPNFNNAASEAREVALNTETALRSSFLPSCVERAIQSARR